MRKPSWHNDLGHRCGFFLATNFLLFVWAVLEYLKNGEMPSDIITGAEVIQVVLRFVFVMGFFFALTLCYWRFPKPDFNFQECEDTEAQIDHGIIDRTGMKPREMQGSQPITRAASSKNVIHEASDSSEILEVDGSNVIADENGLLEADPANSILEADSKLVHEKA